MSYLWCLCGTGRDNTPQNEGESMHEGDVLCLLDFYVHTHLQRQGIGAKLFTAALQVLCRAWKPRNQTQQAAPRVI